MNLIAQLTTDNNLKIEIEENFNFVNIDIKVSGTELLNNIYNHSFILDLFQNISQNDILKIFINYEEESKVVFRSKDSIQTDITNHPTSLFEADYTYIVKIEIKKFIGNKISIYSLDTFLKWFSEGDNIQESFTKYTAIQEVEESILLHVLDQENIEFYSKKFIFSSSENNDIFKELKNEYPNKKIILQHQKEHCFVSDQDIPRLIPDDYFLIKESENIEINDFFKKLSLFNTLMFLADISEIKGDSIFYKLYGYRTIENEYKLSNIKIDALTIFYDLYTWIYQDNNHSTISDKLGIARNIITLHIKNNKLDDVEGNVVKAVKSNFDIYLKENVQRYLEVKNQVSSFVYNMSLRAEDYADNFVSAFKNNVIVFISFFLSIIVVTAIDKGKFVNMFTFEVTSIIVVMLLISWFYKENTMSDLTERKERFSIKYNNFKIRYKDILDETNIEALFNSDSDHNADLIYIDKTIKKYNEFWELIIVLLGGLSILCWLYFDPALLA